MRTLYLEFWTENDDFCIYAWAQEYEKELTLSGRAKEISHHFEVIYKILEEKQKNKQDKLQETLRLLSDLLLTPFIEQIEQCSLVRFIVYEDLVRCAFDLLYFEDRHLFLQRSVCYQIDEGEGEDSPVIELTSALLVADLSADPEKACQAVSKLIPDAEYAEVKDADLKMIHTAASQVDVMVISAHGDVEADNRGAVYINDDTITPKLIAKIEAWIVYFDSCQQGINMAFLDAFQEESDTQFYLGPIISNEAGDSSTKTMIEFFKGVLDHGDPIRALFETRKSLFAYYTTQQKRSLITSLNKAFAFRLYEFVESEEE